MVQVIKAENTQLFKTFFLIKICYKFANYYKKLNYMQITTIHLLSFICKISINTKLAIIIRINWFK